MRAAGGVGLGVLLVIAGFFAAAEHFEVAATILLLGLVCAAMAAFSHRWRPFAWGLGITVLLAVASFWALLAFLAGEPS